MKIYWICAEEQVDDIVTFFMENVHDQYISHGELQDGRAERLGVWSCRAKLRKLLRNQFSRARRSEAGRSRYERLLVARDRGSVRGLAYVEFDLRVRNGYATLYDLIINDDSRRTGLGSRLLIEVEKACKKSGASRLFLESGIDNDDAHRFFKRRGFITSSVTMLKEL